MKRRFITIAVIVLLLVTSAAAGLALAAPDLQGGVTRFVGSLTVTNDVIVGDDITINGNVADRAVQIRFQDVNAALTIRAAASVVTGTTSITTSLLGIDYPRNAVVALASATQRTAGSVVVAGVDARGNSTSETLAMTAITNTETLVGSTAWTSITSLTIPAQAKAITLTVTGGQKFGLPILPKAAGDVYHLTVNATPQAAPTVNTTYGTFDPVSTPAANVDYTVWQKQ